MTVAEVSTQIADIQARLAAMTPVRTTSTDGGAGFASALSGATATGDAGTTLSGTAATGDDVVKAALQYTGVPYVLGGESKSGIDCSGLVQASFKDLGVSVPRLVHEQQTIGQKVDSLKDAKPGDLIVLNGGDHIAIYAGNDTVIHAPYPGRSVSVQKAWFDDKDIVTIRRVVPASDDAGAAATAAAATGSSADAAATTATSPTSDVSSATSASAAAMLAMYGGSDSASSGSDSFASMLSAYGGGTGTSSSTAQQLVAARAALLSTGG